MEAANGNSATAMTIGAPPPRKAVIQSLPSYRTTAKLAKTESQIEGLLEAAHNHVNIVLQQYDTEKQDQHGNDSFSSGKDGDKDGNTGTVTKSKGKGVIVRFFLRKKMKLLGRMASSTSTLNPNSDARYERLKSGCDVLCKQIDDSIEHRQHIKIVLWDLSVTATELVNNVLSPCESKSRSKAKRSNDLRNAFAHLASIMGEFTNTFDAEAAVQTATKKAQLQQFQEKMKEREKLKLDVEIARREFGEMQQKKPSTFAVEDAQLLLQRKQEETGGDDIVARERLPVPRAPAAVHPRPRNAIGAEEELQANTSHGSVVPRPKPLLQRYGSEQAKLPTMARAASHPAQGLLKKSNVFYALNGVALLSVCVSMHSTITRLEFQVATQTTTAGATDRAGYNRRHHPGLRPRKNQVGEDGLVAERLPMAFLPSKFTVDYVTPFKSQENRGTCWDFATVSFLEQSYRQNGWLTEDEYVAFSEQAYGAEILKLCTGPADSPQQKACRVAGDAVWRNSTDGGEVPQLYYLREGLQESVFPHAVCQYYRSSGNGTVCPGMEAARASNPLKFSVKSMETKYDDMSVREYLFRKKQAMPLSTPVMLVTHYYPCIGPFASDPHCQPESCALCPPELAMTTCCVPTKGEVNVNMEGEFSSHYGMSITGGHAMLLVGFNDAFMIREGFTGGLIVKDSTSNGPTVGSHSIAYWMQEVSDWEERAVCPNSWNPFNWYHCGSGGAKVNSSDDALDERIQECLSDETKMFAETNVQPLHLKCQDTTQCRTDGDFVYFVRNTTDWGDHMTVMCLWEYSAEQHIARQVCLKPMLQSAIARTLVPVADEIKENDMDRCGFYFIPYEALRKWVMQVQGFFVNSFDIEWDPRSYAANKADYEEFDYKLLEASTKKQNMSHFLGPFPYAQVVESFPEV